MAKIQVAVLRGGPSSEFEVSLKTGESILKHLSSEKYHARDILIDKKGIWHARGIPIEPRQALEHADVVENAMHGEYGEDGKVQQLLERFGIPYTGSGPLASAIGMNKLLAKQHLLKEGIKTPRHIVLNVREDLSQKLMEVFRTFPQPSVIKPINKGSSVGVTVARDYHEFVEGVQSAFTHSSDILIEEFIRGREATTGVVENFRNEPVYALLPVEIIPPQKHGFFSYDAKYSGETQELCPGNFSPQEKAELIRLAKEVHRILNLRHYSRSDFIVSPRGIYFLEVNTLPGLTSESLFPRSLNAVGSSLSEFLDHIIGLAMSRR